MFKEGDIVEIPLPDGRTAIGRILHISKHFKDAVGFIVFGVKGQIPSTGVDDCLPLNAIGPLYTHIAALKHYGWKIVGYQPVSDAQKLWTKRDVGGGVYIGDEYIGSIEDLGERRLRPMLVMGMPVVYMEIEKAFGKHGEGKGDGHVY